MGNDNAGDIIVDLTAQENDPLLEAIGFTWQLSQLKEIGLCRQNAELVELSFDIDYKKFRGWLSQKYNTKNYL